MSRIVKGDLEVDGTVYADTIRARRYKDFPVQFLKNTVLVSTDGTGANYSSIQDAIDYIKLLANSSWNNPYQILIGPGIYNENIVIDIDGIILRGAGYGKTRIKNVGASDTLTIRPQSPAVYPWDIHLYDISFYNDQAANAALKVDGTLGGAGTSFLGNELGMVNCVLQNTGGGYALDAYLANYISGTWANWSGKVRMVNVSGFWGWYVVPLTSIEITWDVALDLPNDPGNYGFALKTSDWVGAITTKKAGKFVAMSVYEIASLDLQDASTAIIRESNITGAINRASGAVLEWDTGLSHVATQLGTSALTIDATAWPGIVIGTANITTKGNPVVITMTVGITNTSGAKRTYTFRMLRDGVEVNAADRPSAEITAGETFQWDMCFVDEEAEAGAHVYTIEAISSSNNANQVSNHRRITAQAH